MKNNKGTMILQYTGWVFIVLSLVEILFEILSVMHLDILGVASNGLLAQLLFFDAGNASVQILFSFVGLAAGYAAVALAENERFNSYLRWFGVALIVIYLLEGWMLLSSPAVFSWIRLIILLVLAGIYLYGTWQLAKDDEEEEKELK